MTVRTDISAESSGEMERCHGACESRATAAQTSSLLLGAITGPPDKLIQARLDAKTWMGGPCRSERERSSRGWPPRPVRRLPFWRELYRLSLWQPRSFARSEQDSLSVALCSRARRQIYQVVWAGLLAKPTCAITPARFG